MIRQNISSEMETAEVIVEECRKQFDFLDTDQSDLLCVEELAVAFADWDWPKSNSENADDSEYAKTLVEKYDKDNKGGLNFVDFVQFTQDLWDISETQSETKCANGFDRAMEVWDGLFKWLDRNNDGFVTEDDVTFGVARMMYHDCNSDEVAKAFKEHGTDGKLNYDGFVLAVANGLLDKTFSDPNVAKA